MFAVSDEGQQQRIGGHGGSGDGVLDRLVGLVHSRVDQ
jgi:hypothetical protein